MRDLYAKLDLRHSATDEEIRKAIQDTDVAEQAFAILMNPQRREAYNHCHATLRAIGKLRQRLKLDSNETWFSQECGDFVPTTGVTPSLATQPIGAQSPEEIAEQALSQTEAEGRSLLVPLVIVVAVAGAVAAWFFWQ